MPHTPRNAVAALALLASFAVGCSVVPQSATSRASLDDAARETLSRFQQHHPVVYDARVNSAAGVAVFPNIFKIGWGIGGSGGKGVVYQGDAVTGYCDMGQLTFGFQTGAQLYGQVMFFESDADLADFQQGNFELLAQASAVAWDADAAATTDYDNGVAIYPVNGRGLMYEAVIGVQKFTYADAPAE